MKKNLYSLAKVVLLLVASSRAAFADQIIVPPPINVPNVEIGNVISAVVGVMLIIAAIMAFLYLIIGGLQWITSGGDKSGMEAARNRITAAIVGLIIVASAWAVMLLVGRFVGIDLFGGLTVPCITDPTGANC